MTDKTYQRFIEKVDVSGEDDCWIWTASTHGQKQKRGCFWNGKRKMDAARWMFQFSNPGSDIEGLCVRHRCDTPLCVNPKHLELGTQADNVADMHARGRAHQQTNPEVGRRAAMKAHQTMRENPGLRPRGERHGMYGKGSPGSQNPNSKIDEATAVAIRKAVGKQRDIAAQFGCSQKTVWRIKAGKGWTHA